MTPEIHDDGEHQCITESQPLYRMATYVIISLNVNQTGSQMNIHGFIIENKNYTLEFHEQPKEFRIIDIDSGEVIAEFTMFYTYKTKTQSFIYSITPECNLKALHTFNSEKHATDFALILIKKFLNYKRRQLRQQTTL